MQPRDVVNGRFEIDRLAGHGGMGSVYRAVDRQTGAPVAVKVILGRGQELAERFGREAAVLAELQHPGIVRFVASGTTPAGEAYLVMEWIEGESLGDRLARGPHVPLGAPVGGDQRGGAGLSDLRADARLNLYLLDEAGTLRAFRLGTQLSVVAGA